MSTSVLATIHEHFFRGTGSWALPPIARAWFRGHETATWELVPSILRGSNQQQEFQLTKRFRLLAPGFGVGPIGVRHAFHTHLFGMRKRRAGSIGL
jgi:hypothetical protein